MVVVVDLAQNSRCLSPNLPSSLLPSPPLCSLSSPHDGKFFKPATPPPRVYTLTGCDFKLYFVVFSGSGSKIYRNTHFTIWLNRPHCLVENVDHLNQSSPWEIIIRKLCFTTLTIRQNDQRCYVTNTTYNTLCQLFMFSSCDSSTHESLMKSVKQSSCDNRDVLLGNL